MTEEKIKIFEVGKNELPENGEVVHLVGRLNNAVYYNEPHRQGFWLINSNGEKVVPREWFRLIIRPGFKN
jgi:hypothetical protein